MIPSNSEEGMEAWPTRRQGEVDTITETTTLEEDIFKDEPSSDGLYEPREETSERTIPGDVQKQASYRVGFPEISHAKRSSMSTDMSKMKRSNSRFLLFILSFFLLAAFGGGTYCFIRLQVKETEISRLNEIQEKMETEKVDLETEISRLNDVQTKIETEKEDFQTEISRLIGIQEKMTIEKGDLQTEILRLIGIQEKIENEKGDLQIEISRLIGIQEKIEIEKGDMQIELSGLKEFFARAIKSMSERYTSNVIQNGLATSTATNGTST